MEKEENKNVEITKKTIDVEGVFQSKNPKLARFLPGFVFGFIKRVIHQKRINELLYNYRHLRGLDFIEILLKEFDIKVKITNLDKLPAEGRYVCAANHPLGGPDGWAFLHAVSQVRKDIIFPVNDILLNLPVFGDLFIPVNKHGSNAENIKYFNETFEGNKLIMYFPAGLVSRKQNGKIEDLEWKQTFVNKARRNKRDIIPVYISGANSSFFYWAANVRKKLKIKANIEMFLLANEIVKQKGKTIEVIFGDPIPYTTFDTSKRPLEWAKYVKEKVYSIKS